jgi:hypothetical protein
MFSGPRRFFHRNDFGNTGSEYIAREVEFISWGRVSYLLVVFVCAGWSLGSQGEVNDDCGRSIHYGRISLRVGIFLESLYILGEFPWELAASSCGWSEYWTLGRVGANWRIGTISCYLQVYLLL